MSFRDNPLGELKVPLTWAAAIALIVAVVAATAILLSDRRETFKAEAYGVSRKASDTVLAPVGDVLAAPGRWTGAGVDTVSDYFAAGSQNAELKAQLKVMKQWRDVAIALKDENARYKTLLGLKTDPPIPMVAARIVTDSRGPFADTRLANTGSEHGVKVGNPVMSENGLVGRVIGVTDGASRVLLLTDIASRTPVMIDRTNARAILTGDGGPNPRLDYLRGHDPIREGDRLLTSGDGGVVPRGLPVGTAVKGLDGRWRVVLASDKAPIDFVRILLFQDFTQVVNQKALNEAPAPPPTPGPNGAESAKAADSPAPPTVGKPPAAPPTAQSPSAQSPSAQSPSAPPKPKAAEPARGEKKPATTSPSAKKPDAAPKPAAPTKPKPKPPADGGQP
ncbi:rod shape-determining protein MreC [Phenylobacterium sp.]|uniref:rod shape-determining protein MreC n=1 Tax=Phenylobacterium sp. TaxID=1871053 RepID=UPI002C83BCD8|nr:rod shape-determining protein MreC [Phenylobacterium sp.]HLZ76783.1 rod shape-determining protein MreC [Phenylobacterium sp.]